ncbi:class I SAM-dependent methyltransferase [Saccharopolyspora taberi]|uniref:Class I SAM-dependent methyltransferase n=1 Tax=Saccharopolyspora taberi TaxID=60895 RepID=A0ABN3VKF0_9PSEU
MHHEHDLPAEQRRHWEQVYRENPDMYGLEPSEPALFAAELMREHQAHNVLELGAGHGRDALHFARCGLNVHATDISESALEQLRAHARAAGLDVHTAVHDVREPLPHEDASMDVVFAHMLLCMALSTGEIRAATSEIARVLRPGGHLVYTVRHTGDAHYGTGTPHGDDIYEHGGFAVHFFSREHVDALASGWQLLEVHPFEEGSLPRRLWRVTQRKP